MKKRNGFISTTIIYSFFLVFILIMIAILMSYANKAFLKDKIADNITDPGDNEDNSLACKQGDDLFSDCLILAETIEYDALHQKWVDNGNDWSLLTEEEHNRWKANVNILSRTIDLTKNRKEIVKQLKNNYAAKAHATFLDGSQVQNWSNPIGIEIGLVRISDDNGYTFIYRGNEDDNYVLFANKLWSIIRINGDGSIRMIYQGEWENIKSKSNKEKLEYIKDNGFIDVDNNNSYSSNDARHYNINDIGELKGDINQWIYQQNQKSIDKYCNGEAITLDSKILEYINKRGCGTLKSISNSTKNKMNNYGNSDSTGSYTVYNAGFMSNGVDDWKLEDKLSNKSPSTIKSFLDGWYYSNILTYSEYIQEDALFCANKDIAIKDGGLLLEENKCYCTSDSNNNIIDKGDMKVCSNILSGGIIHSYGQCKDDGYEDGFQLNYTLSSSVETVRGSLIYGLSCSDLRNSTFSNNNGTTAAGEKITKMDYPIGLITASELLLAGAPFRKANNDFYLATNFDYWTSDLAFGYNVASGTTYYFVYKGNGDNEHVSVINDVDNVAYIRPVINLHKCVKYKGGKGTINEPYTIEKGDASC